MIRKAILLFIAGVSLNSCTLITYDQLKYIESNHGHIYIMTKEHGLVECPPWIPPALPTMPEIPSVPKNLVGNKKAEENIMVSSLEAHRKQIRELRDMVRNSFREYVESCME